jgi:hypothetical protein
VNGKVVPVPHSPSFSGHFPFGEVGEILAAAMHRRDVGQVEFFEFGRHSREIVGRRGREVETADQCVDAVNAGDLLRA